jgi:phosphoenolpyruvate synthase/pyruvate phosphate dikinase
MALDDPDAVPGVVGGKGASLARLTRAGFRVPPGFHVTTSAYLDFIERGGLLEPMLAAMSAVDVSDAATYGAASARIGELFAGQPLPASTAAAISGAYAGLGDDVPVAVRSSATVEDLAGMSAAGQHDTYLNIVAEAAVLDAVKRCWASLWYARVPSRRAIYETYRALPPYPTLIRGHFDPVRWAADPNRRSDYYDGRAHAANPDDAITGFPGAAGVVEGTARVLRSPEEAAQLGEGEILVTTVTNIGWTTIFPRAAAIVTDVGAPISHAAIVARELGIPAVVGCGNATMRVRSGDWVRVDGGRGTVEVLRPAST